ncbi:hypothetical protein ACROYT_G024098 [Oculina patagonica]
MDTVTKFKNVANGKTGKAMENARLMENMENHLCSRLGYQDNGWRLTCMWGFCPDHLDDFGFPPAVLCVRIVMEKRRKDPGDEIESLEPTVQIDGQQFLCHIQDGGRFVGKV